MEVSEETNNVSQLCLQWHHHHKTLVSILDLLWEKQELVDVTLAAEGQYLQVHRIVLCACSRYFQDILTQINSNDKHAIVFLKDVDFQDLQALVHYMYKGEVRINEGQLASFLKTAKSLGVRGLMGDEAKGETTRKRQRDSSVDSSEENSQDELHIPTAPPPPPPLKHKTSLTKNIDVKRESLSNTEAGPMESPHLQTLESNHLSSTSLTTADLESNGLPLFPCPDDPGPSRTSEDDANSSEHNCASDHQIFGQEASLLSIIGRFSSSGKPFPRVNNVNRNVDGKRDERSPCAHLRNDHSAKERLHRDSSTDDEDGQRVMAHTSAELDAFNHFTLAGTSVSYSCPNPALTVKHCDIYGHEDAAAMETDASKNEEDNEDSSSEKGKRMLLSNKSLETPGHYPCTKCGRSYSLQRNLWRHCKFECQTNLRYQCPVCGKPFAYAYRLKNHMSIH